MKNKVISFVIVALIAISFSFLGSFVYNYVFEESKKPKEDKVSVSLALSETQTGKMKECQHCFKDNCGAINSESKKKKIDLIKELKEDNPNTDHINALLSEIDSLQSLLLHTTVQNILEQKDILDDSQKDKFFSILINQMSNEQKTNKTINH
jgi:hypothetical protein